MLYELSLLLAGIGSCVAALGSLLAMVQSLRNAKAIHRVHVELNSRLTQLLALTAVSSHAQGVAFEAARNKKEGN